MNIESSKLSKSAKKPFTKDTMGDPDDGKAMNILRWLNHTNKHPHVTYTNTVRITIYLLKPLMLCALILFVIGGTYSLTSTPNDRFLRNFLMAVFIYSQSFCQKSAERKSPDKYFSYFNFWWLTWDTDPGFCY